jgi:hypothetical protein
MAWGDPSLLQSAQRGNVVQLQRKGFYVVDQVRLQSHLSRFGCVHPQLGLLAA